MTEGGPMYTTSTTEGMSLRDYFAAAVLQTCPLLFEQEEVGTGRCGEWKHNDRGIVARCYAISDAMLYERERTK